MHGIISLNKTFLLFLYRSFISWLFRVRRERKVIGLKAKIWHQIEFCRHCRFLFLFWLDCSPLTTIRLPLGQDNQSCKFSSMYNWLFTSAKQLSETLAIGSIWYQGGVYAPKSSFKDSWTKDSKPRFPNYRGDLREYGSDWDHVIFKGGSPLLAALPRAL